MVEKRVKKHPAARKELRRSPGTLEETGGLSQVGTISSYGTLTKRVNPFFTSKMQRTLFAYIRLIFVHIVL